MTVNENESESDKIAGQCDICDEPIDLNEDNAKSIGLVRSGNEVTPEEAIEALASSLELASEPEDYRLAEALREKNSYTVHEACFEKTGLVDEEVGPEPRVHGDRIRFSNRTEDD